MFMPDEHVVHWTVFILLNEHTATAIPRRKISAMLTIFSQYFVIAVAKSHQGSGEVTNHSCKKHSLKKTKSSQIYETHVDDDLDNSNKCSFRKYHELFILGLPNPALTLAWSYSTTALHWPCSSTIVGRLAGRLTRYTGAPRPLRGILVICVRKTTVWLQTLCVLCSTS